MADWINEWSDAAREEYHQALRYYREIDRRLAADLKDRVDRAVGLILENRDVASSYLQGTRRKVLKRFPYTIIYRVDRERQVVEVVAFVHQSRKPGYWLGR